MTPWERLTDFVANNEIHTIRREAPSLISWLAELEELMISADLWTHSEGEARPLDKAAARRMEPRGLDYWSGWRSPGGWSVAKLGAFAVRAFIDAEHKIAEDPRRQQRETA